MTEIFDNEQTFLTGAKISQNRDDSKPQNYVDIYRNINKAVNNLDTRLIKFLTQKEAEYDKNYSDFVSLKQREMGRLESKLKNAQDHYENLEKERLREINNELNEREKTNLLLNSQLQKLQVELISWKAKSINCESDLCILKNKLKETLSDLCIFRVVIKKIAEKIKLSNEKSADPSETLSSIDIVCKLFIDLKNGINQKNLDQSINILMANSRPTPSWVHKQLLIQGPNSSGKKNPKQNNFQISAKNKSFVGSFETVENSELKKKMEEQLEKFVVEREQSLLSQIKHLKLLNSKMMKDINKLKKEQASRISNKNELKNLFIQCVEEARNDLLKKEKNKILPKAEEEKNQIELICKLSQLKEKIGSQELSKNDKIQLISFFLCNDFVMNSLYDILFPNAHSSIGNAKEKEIEDKIVFENSLLNIFKNDNEVFSIPEELNNTNLEEGNEPKIHDNQSNIKKVDE